MELLPVKLGVKAETRAAFLQKQKTPD